MAHRVGGIGRENGKDVQMFFDSLAQLVGCTLVDADGKVAGQIQLDELLNQYADDINGGLTHIAQQITTKDGVHGLRIWDNKLQYNDGGGWADAPGGGGGGSGTPLGDCTGISITPQSGALTLKWKDPDDVVVSGATLVAWAHTVLVRKQGSYPASANDGTVVLTSAVRNQYQTTGFVDTGLTNGTAYFYKLIPVSKTGAVNLNAANNISGTPARIIIPTVPSQSGTLAYTGNAQSPVWANYDAVKMTVGGVTSSTNTGTFTATFTPTSNYQWNDNTTTAKTATWSIGKAAGGLSLNPSSLTLDASNLSKAITVTRAGDGLITATSSNTGVATVSVSGTTVTVTHVKQTTGTASITVNAAAGTNHNAPSSKTCAVTAQFLPVKQSLNAMSWADINTICQAGKAVEYWSRGDTKTIALTTGESITVRIEDFAHDDLTGGGGKAKMTLGMVHCLNATRQMNSSNTNNGGWGSSAMKSFMTTLLGQLPSDLQAVIKSVTKKSSAGNASSSLTTTEDKIWLFSHTEVNLPANASYSPGGEGAAYPLFISDASRIKNVSGSAYYWWLRSPYATNTTYFCHVNSNGTASGNSASYSYGVSAGFCL